MNEIQNYRRDRDDEPTRETTCSKSLIDHFYSNRKQNIVSAGISRITISDHYLIYGIKKFPSLKESNDSLNSVTLKISISKITCMTFLK